MYHKIQSDGVKLKIVGAIALSSLPLGSGVGLRLETQLNANHNPNPRGVRKCNSAKLLVTY